jgi:glutamyl-tRNA(Gln) amidotransferase subunit E
VGLEIHQQVGRPTDHKLFCHCPADIVERQPDRTIMRGLRASAGETGAIDAAAEAAARQGKRFVYHAFHDATCLVELDEEPPHPVNQEVITTAVMVAKACGSTILPRVQFMRKTIVDGSATSGFQRTGLIAFGGIVPGLDEERPVRLQTVCVEEDAAKIVTRTAHEDTFNLSRLGIPLIEIATEPDITTPEQAQEVAAQLGMILRSTKRVKRGLGTIRQDINVSVPGGTRIEIKGCQDLRMLPTYIRNEAMRQRSLLDVKTRLPGTAATFPAVPAIIDVTALCANGKGFIKSAIAKGDHAAGILLPGFAGILGTELCPNYRVGSELADRARDAGFGGMIHSDEDFAKYGLDKDALASAFGASATANDAFLFLIGDPARIAATIHHAIVPRVRALALGIPSEVRKANPDGTTSFLRPMPGAARMYPETDIPLVHVDASAIQPPKLLTEQAHDLAAKGISHDQATQLVREGIPFDDYLERYPHVEPSFLATAALTYGKEIQARYKKELDHLPLLEPLFDAVEQNALPKSAVFEILVAIAEGKTTITTVKFADYAPLPEEDLRRMVRAAIVDVQGPPKPSVLMGKVMALARGKADGKTVMRIIEEELAGQL